MPKLDISIAGELNLDLILYGLPHSLPTERELLAKAFTMTLGSSSAILAHNLAALGTNVGFITKVGNDSFGDVALERLSTAGVYLTKVVRDSSTGSGITVILPHDPDRHILTYPGTIFELRYEDLDLEYLASAPHFHMSSFFLQRSMADRIPDLFRFMKKRGLTTSLDTNDDPDDRWAEPLQETLRYVDVLLPNQREICKIAGEENLEQAIAKVAENVPLVVVKLGATGALAARGRDRFTSPATRVEVVDPIGAGDSFNAGFLHKYLRGAGVEECLLYGNRAGALSTTASGGTEAFRDGNKVKRFFAAEKASA